MGKLRGAPFKPGQSGNPGGRPKRPATVEARKIITDVKEAAKAYTLEAIETLAEVMRSPKSPPAAKVSAAGALLDRGWGKPSQTIVASARDARQLTDDELYRIAAGGLDEQGSDGSDQVH